MKAFSKTIFLFIIFWATTAKAQSSISLSAIMETISGDWRKDSSSCPGLRLKIYEPVLTAKPDSTTKEQLLKKLGRPNYIKKFYSGHARKNYVEYIYFIYKDECPKVGIEGYAIGFVFDESETILVEIKEHEYCG